MTIRQAYYKTLRTWRDRARGKLTDIEIWCAECGAGLCGQTQVKGDAELHITPCQKCLDAAELRGYEEGYSKGLEDGKSESIRWITPAKWYILS